MSGLERFDTSRPDAARVLDCLLGGRDNFAADRELAARIAEADPAAAKRARENRAFLAAATVRAAREGVSQFIVAGCGFPRPAGLNIHDAAREAAPGARVCYVDRDPVALVHARALLAGPGVAASGADPADPAAVLSDPDVLSVIDPAEPFGVIIVSLLHFLPEDAARDVCAGYADAMPPGSWLICTGSWFDDAGLLARLREVFTPAEIHPHPPQVFRGFFSGLNIVPPGITSARRWVAGVASGPPCRKAGYVLAAAGIKPQR